MSGKFLKQLSQEATSPSGSAEGKKGKQKRGRGKKHQTTVDEPLQGSGWEIKFMSTIDIILPTDWDWTLAHVSA